VTNDKKSNTYNFNTAMPIMTEIFTWDKPHEWAFVCGPRQI